MLILSFDLIVIAASLFGWLISLPLVLLVRNVRAWRFGMYWVIGIGLGPLIVLVVNWIAASQGLMLAGISGGLAAAYALATAISGFSSLIYLVLLRRGQARAALHASEAVV